MKPHVEHPLFSLSHIFDQVSAVNCQDLFRKMAPLMAHVCGIPASRLFQCLIERERLGSTYWKQGIALPHGSLPELKKPVLFLTRLKSPISYESERKSKVDLVCFIWVPASMESYGSQLLLKTSRLLQQAQLAEKIRRCNTSREIYALFHPQSFSLAA